MLGAAVGGGWWYLGRDDDIEQTVETYSGPPAAEPTELWSAVGGFLGGSGAIDPYQGLIVEDGDGTTYIYDGGTRWSAITPDGSVWAIPGTSAQLIEDEGGVISIANADSDVGWMEEILDDTPGVVRSGSGYVVVDEAAYRDGIIATTAAHGAIFGEQPGSPPTILNPPTTDIGYVYPEEDHAWIITRDGAGLIVEDEGDLVMAGSILVGPDGQLAVEDFEPAPGRDTQSVRDILRSGKFGTYRTDAADLVPTPAADCRTLDEIYRNAPVDEEGAMLLSASDLAEACENRPEAQAESRRQAAIQQDWNRVFASPSEDDDDGFGCSFWVLDCVATGALAVPGLIEGGYHATIGNLDDYTVCLIDEMICPDWYWEQLTNLWAERDCGSIGPGSGENGKGAPRYSADYPVASVAREVGYTDEAVLFAEQRLALARAWMPRMELSDQEICGEILRVVARVTAYTPDGDRVLTDLAEADRVEITYTMFFRQDGGRFGQEWHPGDNEGFVIALTRRDASRGLCRGTEFEFFGGRAVAHQDASGWFQEHFHVTERHIEDFSVGTSRASGDQPITDPCPSEGPEGGYYLHTSESKHATYYNRDICEAALVPDSPVVLAAFVIGFFAGAVGGAALGGALGGPLGSVVGGTAGGVATGALSAVAVQAILNTMPDGMKWQDGMEECERGRTPYDLSDRVELFDEGFANKTEYFSQDFSGDAAGEHASFAERARGSACPRVEWGFSDSCLEDDFRVPGFFDAPAASPAQTDATEVPRVLDLDESTAIGRLEDDGFDVRSTPRTTNDPAEDGIVIDQAPRPFTQVDPGIRVIIYVGRYQPANVFVPDLYRMTEATARLELRGEDLAYVDGGTVEVNDPTLDRVVVDQSPPAGTTVAAGDEVTVWLGVYVPATEAVPSLLGKTESAATTELSERGFIPEYAGTQVSSTYAGRVAAQDPGSGATLEVGSIVRYWIGVAPEVGTTATTEPQFPYTQHLASDVWVLFGDGHGATHSIGEVVSLCWGWPTIPGEPPGKWVVWDYQPVNGTAVKSFEGSAISGDGQCELVTITGPAGYERVAVATYIYSYSTSSYEIVEYADVYIRVVE